MEYLYIDESGSLTSEFAFIHPNFVMCVVRVKDITNLRKLLKRFIYENYQEIKEIDEKNKIFNHGDFVEIKGSSLNSKLKKRLADFLCNGNILEIYYIHVFNEEVKQHFYDDPSLIYNYVLYLMLNKNLGNKNLPYDDYLIDVDDRNLKHISINSLEDYLNIELKLKKRMVRSINIEYYDSKDNLMVQVSDFFSNLYFSYLKNHEMYNDLITNLKEKGYIRDIFYYPNKKD
ncbi:MAG: DUF3800 domain-containing protein [Bacilli bacterium]|nr:DUF3800 domain-containing protein [Bacilli bacterium]